MDKPNLSTQLLSLLETGTLSWQQVNGVSICAPGRNRWSGCFLPSPVGLDWHDIFFHDYIKICKIYVKFERFTCSFMPCPTATAWKTCLHCSWQPSVSMISPKLACELLAVTNCWSWGPAASCMAWEIAPLFNIRSADTELTITSVWKKKTGMSYMFLLQQLCFYDNE